MNEAPTAQIEVTSQDGLSVTLSAAESRDPDGEISSYEWSFGDGNSATGEQVTHEYEEPGSYSVTLTVTDDAGGTGEAGTDVAAGTVFNVTVENVAPVQPVTKSGAFTPEDENPTLDGNSKPLRPGEAFQFSFTTGTEEIPETGTVMSFATMFIQSNDMYYAFAPGGVPLYDENDEPIGLGGAVSLADSINMYDAGTEEDQEPGTGDNQPMRGGPNVGPDDDNNVVLVTDTDDDGMLDDDGFDYPPATDVIDVRVESERDDASGGYEFTVTVENVADENQAASINGSPVVLSGGTFAAHFDQTPGGEDVTYPAHTPGSAANGTGIEDIAEDGDPSAHAQTLAGLTGVTVPLSPGAYAAHSDEVQVFQAGNPAGTGVERIAEDGKPATLAEALGGVSGITDRGAFTSPDGMEGDSPIAPGQSYSFEVGAVEGDVFSFVTMYIQSNDLFYGFQSEGIPLFEDGEPINTEVTGQVNLYDAGTEEDEEPGVGLNQAPRQSMDDAGTAEDRTIVEVTDTDGDEALEDSGYEYLPTSDVIRVTIEPQN